MKALLKIQAIILILLCSWHRLTPQAYAVEASLGPITGTYPGLSLHLSRENDQSFHLGAQVSDSNAFIVNLDFQRILAANLFSWSNIATSAHLYAGVGAMMSAKPHQDLDRMLYYHMPLGLQFDYTDGIIHAFTEAALILGPMPKTTASIMPLMGLRTRF